MLSIGGRGMLSNTVYPRWIAQVLGRRIGSSCTVKGHQNSGFRDLTIPCENFSIPPTTLTTTTTTSSSSCLHALCDVSALALGLNFEDPGS